MQNLSFNQWQAYLLAVKGHGEQFKSFCESCKFTDVQIEQILELI